MADGGGLQVIPVRDLLDRIADEVQILADLARSVENAGVVGARGHADARHFNNIQDIDRLVQSLGDISAFVRACAVTVTTVDHVVEIAEPVSAIKLQTIRERLSGDTKPSANADRGGSHGRLHLF